MESATTQPAPTSRKKVPAYLVKEEFDGIPLYYKGYKEVLAGKKTLEDIKPSSSIHSLILTYLTLLIGKNLDESLYQLLVGEIGIITSANKKAGLDIAIFDKKVLTPEMINRHFVKVPPKVVVEVDVDVESDFMLPDEVIQFRTQKLLGVGVEKVIWIFTLSRKIMLAEQGQDWRIFDWDREVEVLEGISFNIADYLEKSGYNNF